MTMRVKVLLVMGMAMGLLVFMGLVLNQTVSTGRTSRDRLLLIQEQIDSFGRLHVASEQYLRALVRARDTGADSGPVLRTLQKTIDQEQIILREMSRMEHAQAGEHKDFSGEWDETLLRLREWASRAQRAILTSPAKAQQHSTEWELFEDFERDAGELIRRAQLEEYQERGQVKQTSDKGLNRAGLLAVLFPIASCALLLWAMLIVLFPLGRALRELLAVAQRVGAGELHVRLSEKRGDELGTLARAFNHMAAALSSTQALLEEKVRERTAQLEQANSQLVGSMRQLKETQSQLFFAERLASIGQLAAGVGHEINNPLSYVLSNLSYAHKEVVRYQESFPEQEREELLEALSQARDGAERVRFIVKDLKELARPSDERTGPVELHTVVRTAVKLVSREMSQRARLVEECEGVPPVLGSSTRLGQVFLNLLINATHALPKGEPDKHEIRVAAWQSTPELVTVEVSDTGSGIAPEHLSRIFDPFFTTKPTGEGTGLGLSVCHSIVTSLGGQLTVQSTLGKGTTFRMVLPVAPDPGKAPYPASAS
jgi:two-component system NtrC family sensor kinase